MKKDTNVTKFKHKLVLTISIFIAIILIFVGAIYATNYVFKGELNGDKIIDYSDAELLELQLINIQKLEEDKLSNADMNSDGEITITDLTLLIKKIEKILKYEVHIYDDDENEYYTEQNKDITLKFNADVSYDAKIVKATINGEEIEVTKTEEETDEYSFKANSGAISGVKTYNFTEVELDNGKKVKVDYILKIDVLKQLPEIKNYKAEENINAKQVKVSFDVIDKDSAVTQGTLTVLNDKQEVIKEVSVVNGKNEADIDVEYGKQYKAKIVLYYELGTNELEQKENHSGKTIIEKDLEMIKDYDLKITSIKTRKNNELCKEFEKNEQIELVFESTNTSQYDVIGATINGKEYDVTKFDNNKYSCISKRCWRNWRKRNYNSRNCIRQWKKIYIRK